MQVPGRSSEELRGRLLLGRRPGDHVDHALHARQRLPQTLPGDYVHAAGTRHRNDVVSPGLEHVDDMTADPPGRPGYRNLPACFHDCSPPVVFRCFVGHGCRTSGSGLDEEAAAAPASPCWWPMPPPRSPRRAAAAPADQGDGRDQPSHADPHGDPERPLGAGGERPREPLPRARPSPSQRIPSLRSRCRRNRS
jgi:hypothetical protein